MRLIDAEMLIAYVKKYGFYCDTEADKEATIKEIEMFPTIPEAVEILKKIREHETDGGGGHYHCAFKRR